MSGVVPFKKRNLPARFPPPLSSSVLGAFVTMQSAAVEVKDKNMVLSPCQSKIGMRMWSVVIL